jgi:leucyl/phenylalanyl-tRNA---protein transferase
VATTKISIPQLHPKHHAFPSPYEAGGEGLLAWGGDLSQERLVRAYEMGIFPWFNEGDPILWWSPDPRAVLFPDEMKISKSLRHSMKHFEIRYDTCFEAVMRLCWQTRVQQGKKSWISEALIEAFLALHAIGLAHSVECYYEGELVGGLYGLYIGAVFCGESMFSTKRDASKVALFGLCEKMRAIGGAMIDCQLPTEHLKSLGAIEMPRTIFLDAMARNKTIKAMAW